VVEIRQALEVIAAPDSGPLAFHCASGKDRTGQLAAARRGRRLRRAAARDAAGARVSDASGKPVFEVLPVTAARWPELEGFFGPSGAYSHCWCAWWRVSSSEFKEGCADRGAGNHALLERLTLDGAVPGLLAYEAGEAGEPVGWVALAPRGQYPRLLRSPTLRPEPGDREAQDEQDEAGVWSLTCFWIPRAHRGRGVATALLDAAVVHARARGAAALEAYPVDTGGERGAPSSLYTGTLGMFLRAGFREVRRRRDRRPVVRIELRRSGGC
jgi:ribosomal protein S18 acetylase RimI-like enzyme